MEYLRTLDEYCLDATELDVFYNFLKQNRFLISGKTICDALEPLDEIDVDLEKSDCPYSGCGEFTDLPIPGIAGRELRVIRGKRLEETMKEYMKSQEAAKQAAGSRVS
jgi:hypothetical protein